MRHKLYSSFHPWCPGVKTRCLWYVWYIVWASGRYGVNSIPELELQVNSNSNSEMELELKLTELKMELELKILELELKTGIEFFATATTAFIS